MRVTAAELHEPIVFIRPRFFSDIGNELFASSLSRYSVMYFMPVLLPREPLKQKEPVSLSLFGIDLLQGISDMQDDVVADLDVLEKGGRDGFLQPEISATAVFSSMISLICTGIAKHMILTL